MPQKARVRYKTHLHGSMVVSRQLHPAAGQVAALQVLVVPHAERAGK